MLKTLIGGVASAWQACLACLCAGLLLGGVAVWRVESWREGAQQTKQAVATTRLVVHEAKIGTELGTLYVPQYYAIQSETKDAAKEIAKHVTPEIDGAYLIPLGFVRVWNSRTNGPVPPATAGSDADPSGTKLSSVADAHNEDVGSLKVCLKQNDEWWDWYDRNAAAWNKVYGK
jgi:hypothetical protein